MLFFLSKKYYNIDNKYKKEGKIMNKNLIFKLNELSLEDKNNVKNILNQNSLDYYVPLLTTDIIYIEIKESKVNSMLKMLHKFDIDINEQGEFTLFIKE